MEEQKEEEERKRKPVNIWGERYTVANVIVCLWSANGIIVIAFFNIYIFLGFLILHTTFSGIEKERRAELEAKVREEYEAKLHKEKERRLHQQRELEEMKQRQREERQRMRDEKREQER